MPKKTKTITTKPRQAMSPRQVDRLERDLSCSIRELEGIALGGDVWARPFIHKVIRRLTRVLASTRRAERRG